MSNNRLNFSQQNGGFSPSCAEPVTVIGAGSVGSHLVDLLASTPGVNDITVYDGDDIESHNIPASVYFPDDLGQYKVFALQKYIRAKSNLDITVHSSMYEGEPLAGVVIACVDNMSARARIWERVRNNPLVPIFIDTRTAEEMVQVFAIYPCNTEDRAYYEDHLFPDSETLNQNCGHHTLRGTAMNVATKAWGNLLQHWKRGKKARHTDELALGLQRV